MKARKKGFTLVELLVVVVIIGVMAALLLPAIMRAIRASKMSKCASNLKQLYSQTLNYVAKFGGPDAKMPTEVGGNFWLRLQNTSPPLVDPTAHDLYKCPLTLDPPAQNATDYRGPANNVNSPANYQQGDPMGADRIGNHGDPAEGGNLLRVSGDVNLYSGVDPLWVSAATKTCP